MNCKINKNKNDKTKIDKDKSGKTKINKIAISILTMSAFAGIATFPIGSKTLAVPFATAAPITAANDLFLLHDTPLVEGLLAIPTVDAPAVLVALHSVFEAEAVLFCAVGLRALACYDLRSFFLLFFQILILCQLQRLFFLFTSLIPLFYLRAFAIHHSHVRNHRIG